MLKRNKVIISGRVTGVFLRRFIYDHALRLKLKGYVKNISDKVEAVFEGSEDSVKQMIEFCKIGNPISRVESVEVVEEPIKGEKEFKILDS